LEQCKKSAIIDKEEIINKLENDLLMETEKKVIKEEMIENVACDIRKSVDTYAYSRN